MAALDWNPIARWPSWIHFCCVMGNLRSHKEVLNVKNNNYCSSRWWEDALRRVLEDSWLWNLREPMIDFWQSPLHAFGSLFWVDKAKICLAFLIFSTRGKKSSNKCRPPGGWSGEATFSWHWWCQKGPGCFHTQPNVDSTLFLSWLISLMQQSSKIGIWHSLGFWMRTLL